MFEWKDIEMKDYALIQQAHALSDVDRQVLVSLYQPIIGAKATAVYMFFSSLTSKPVRMTHQMILNRMHLSMHEFYEGRTRLESIGLLKTYRTTKEELDKYVYDMQTPITPYTFFNDPVYCGLLLDQVGNQVFKQLKNMYRIEAVDLTEYTDVSKTFGHIFGNQVNLYTDNEQVIGDQRAVLKIEDTGFDWKFFNDLIVGTYVRPEQLTVDVKQAILTIHQMYQTSPLEMREFVLQAHSLSDNEIHIDKLYATARQISTQQVKPVVSVQTPDNGVDTLKEKGYPDTIIQLIRTCEKMAPSDFLANIKQQKSKKQSLGLTYPVEKTELQIVERLLREYRLPADVVNVLLYYVLIVLDHAALSQAYVMRVASDWVKSDIVNAERAIQYLKKREEVSRTKAGNQSKKGRVTEVRMTESEKQALHDKDVPVDEQTLQKLRERLK